jgi:hypothetical protein
MSPVDVLPSNSHDFSEMQTDPSTLRFGSPIITATGGGVAGTVVVVVLVLVDVVVLVDVLVVVLGGTVVVVVLPPGTVVVVVVLPPGTLVVVVVGRIVVVVPPGTVVVVVPPGTLVVVVLDVVVVVMVGDGIEMGCLRIGMSPGNPHWKLADVVKSVLDSRRSQTPADGRNTAMSVLPSPSKSPGTGTSSARPHWNAAKLW